MKTIYLNGSLDNHASIVLVEEPVLNSMGDYKEKSGTELTLGKIYFPESLHALTLTLPQ